MNSMRNFICVLTALMLAAFALPSLGAQSQNKTYTLTMSPPGVGSTAMLATFKNTSPTKSSSTFGAVDLFVDTDWLIDTSVPPVVKVNTVDVTASVSIDTSLDGHLQISNLGPIKPNDILTVAFSVDAGSCGDGNWNAVVWSGSQVGTGNFFTSGSDPTKGVSPVACNSAFCGFTSNVAVNGVLQILRSSPNKDGSTGASCVATDVFISNTTDGAANLPPDIVHFRWANADTTFATAVFEYQLQFSNGIPLAPKVGWLHQDGTLAVDPGSDPNAFPGNPVIFVQAPQCLTANLPAQYTTLAGDVAANANKITVNAPFTPAGVSAPPTFPIVIGTERMDVYKMTGPSNTTWWVNRTAGVKHFATNPVVSTPLPLLPGISPVNQTPLPPPPLPYQSGMQAQTCIPPGGYDSQFNLLPNVIEYFDIGDVWHLP